MPEEQLHTLVFMNAEAKPKNVKVVLDTNSIEDVMSWYSCYYAGDRYTVACDGRNVPMDLNGSPLELPVKESE